MRSRVLRYRSWNRRTTSLFLVILILSSRPHSCPHHVNAAVVRWHTPAHSRRTCFFFAAALTMQLLYTFGPFNCRSFYVYKTRARVVHRLIDSERVFTSVCVCVAALPLFFHNNIYKKIIIIFNSISVNAVRRRPPPPPTEYREKLNLYIWLIQLK